MIIFINKASNNWFGADQNTGKSVMCPVRAKHFITDMGFTNTMTLPSLPEVNKLRAVIKSGTCKGMTDEETFNHLMNAYPELFI